MAKKISVTGFYRVAYTRVEKKKKQNASGRAFGCVLFVCLSAVAPCMPVFSFQIGQNGDFVGW